MEGCSVPRAGLPLLLVFALTLFVSATLLFLVQPMIGKMLLPLLGGTPAVWNTCMVFFQALLLAGYAYAHATTAWLGVRRQALLHLVVLVLPFLTLGFTVDRNLLDYGEGSPIPGLLLALFLTVGLPFFVVSTSAPLLQKWFSATGHGQADDPYFLYAASNLGSMVGLNGYLIVIEPWLTLAEQRLLWQIGYGLLVVLTAACAALLWRSAQSANPQAVSDRSALSPLTSHHSPPTTLRRLRWVALAFVPSSLMLGVTTYMTTDIAAIPLLWVIPLDLYLLSFILVFSRLPLGVHRVMVVALPILLLALIFLMLSDFPLGIVGRILVHLTVLFVVAMVCHGELARDRPSTHYLTEFFLWMSLGGVLGGLFNALVAPVIFNGLIEYPLALVLACLLTPTLEGEKGTRVGPVIGTGLVGLFAGAGAALLLAAVSRNDLDFNGLAGTNGLWLLAGLIAGAGLAMLYPGEDADDQGARWLDLALPASLGILVVGLNLGLWSQSLQRAVGWSYVQVHDFLELWLPRRVTDPLIMPLERVLTYSTCLVLVVFCYLFVKRPVRFGLGVAAVFLGTAFCALLDEDVMLRERSFFGALRVADNDGFRRLEHGTTLHGSQRRLWTPQIVAGFATGPLAAPDSVSAAVLLAVSRDTVEHPGREPQTYFHRTGPIGQVFETYRDHLANRHVAVIGLGSGTLASYGQPGQEFTYYEIDPLVKRIAYDSRYFTYVPDAVERGVKLDVVMGDARVKLEERSRQNPAPKIALLVIDAFSSDAIPVHLITEEAVDIYLRNLAEDGMIAFHISNRYLDLEPVLGNLAAKLGLVGFIQKDSDDRAPGKAASNWVILARDERLLDRLVHEGRWERWQARQNWAARTEAMLVVATLPDLAGAMQAQGAIGLALFERLRPPWRRLNVRPEVGIWSDDYSNLLRVFDW
jgi:hypothetical protein